MLQAYANGIDQPTSSHLQSAAHLHTAKLRSQCEFVEIFCKWSQTAKILIFISPVALF
jgi:hypothetical protein